MRQGSYARQERDQAIAGLSRAGVPLHTITLALRHARTLARLAEAQCNGDWPADNGERKVSPCGGGVAHRIGCRVRVCTCHDDSSWGTFEREGRELLTYPDGCSQCGCHRTGCAGLWAPSVLVGPGKLCPDCRAETRVRELLGPYGEVLVQGDPRGYVASLKLADGREVGLA